MAQGRGAAVTTQKRMGRPRNLARRAEQQEAVLAALCEGRGVRSTGVTTREVLDWQLQDAEFARRYAHARRVQLAQWAEDIVEISDGEGDPQRDRLRVDARKWILGKMLPHVYGDRVTVAGDADAPVVIRDDADRAARIQRILDTARSRVQVVSEPQEAAQQAIPEQVDSTQGGEP